MNFKLLTAITLSTLCIQAHADTSTTTTATTTANAATAATASQDPASMNRQKGQAFLSTNKSKAGVVTLPDGLQYKVITKGKGNKPGANDVVTVEYTGKLINGTVFDSSSQHGGTANFPVGQVIPGWTEALQLMPVGSTWEIYVPENLAYGDQGAAPAIGPNETLIFEIKLLDSKKS